MGSITSSKSKADPSKIRYFKRPRDLNLRADTITEFSDLKKALSEPPVTMKLSMEELLLLKETPLDMEDIVCNTQGVEHVVPVVTRSAKTVTNAAARDGFVFNVLSSRAKNPKPRNKKSFNPQ